MMLDSTYHPIIVGVPRTDRPTYLATQYFAHLCHMYVIISKVGTVALMDGFCV